MKPKLETGAAAMLHAIAADNTQCVAAQSQRDKQHEVNLVTCADAPCGVVVALTVANAMYRCKLHLADIQA